MQDPKKSPEIRHLGTIAELCWAISSQLRHVSTVRKKLVKQQCLLHMSSQYGEHRPTNSWDRFTSLVHLSKFQWVSGLGFVTAPWSFNGHQPNFVRCLAVSCAGTVYIHFWGLLPPNAIVLGAEFTESKYCALLYSCFLMSHQCRHILIFQLPLCCVLFCCILLVNVFKRCRHGQWITLKVI